MKYRSDMTREEKLYFYANVKRASAKKVHKVIGGDFKRLWVATLGGNAVTLDSNNHGFQTRKDAVEHARLFRESCRKELSEMGPK